MFVSGIRLSWGCPTPSLPENGLIDSVIQWGLALYMAHPFVVPLVIGAAIAGAMFAARNLLRRAIVALWSGFSWVVHYVTWPLRKTYSWAFGRKATSKGGRLPIIGEKAIFGPDHRTGLKEKRLVIVTGAHGGLYRGYCLYSGAQFICSPENVESV